MSEVPLYVLNGRDAWSGAEAFVCPRVRGREFVHVANSRDACSGAEEFVCTRIHFNREALRLESADALFQASKE